MILDCLQMSRMRIKCRSIFLEEAFASTISTSVTDATFSALRGGRALIEFLRDGKRDVAVLQC